MLLNDCALQVACMTLNGGVQHLGVNLCCPNVLVSEHSGNIFDRDIVRQGERSKRVPCYMEGQRLLDTCLLYTSPSPRD